YRMGHDTPQSSSGTIRRTQAIGAKLGCPIADGARVLDLGCGAGRTVYAYRDAGFDACGFDIKDYLSLRDESDRRHFSIGFDEGNRLPFADEQFDLVISEQVFEHVKDQAPLLRELHRIMRPGGLSLHVFPARYAPIEPHIFVPFGSILMHRWYYRIWATLGIRNQYQRGLSAREVAHRNACYAVEGLNYVPSSLYNAICREIGFRVYWFEQENFDTSHRRLIRLAGRVNRVVPLLGWGARTFHTRRLALIKQS
ncbi:MAG: class I SAM-dependent methyltransferase, partial [Nitrospira sp.]|nr:class I SAM-dependent methyltransferase [Nitrospira sp.]